MATRYLITETENGFILETEWDCDEGGTDKTVNVFQDAKEEGMKYVFDNLAQFIRKKYEDY